METSDNRAFLTISIHDVTVNISSPDQALNEVSQLLKNGGRHYVCFFEGNMLHCSYRDSEVHDILNGASLCYPDGIATAKLASWVLGKDVERVSGPSFILKACEYGVANGWRHFFLGGKPGVAEELAKTLTGRYAGLQVVGTYCPPFRDMTDMEIEALCQELREKKVDLLWVALGGPRQEIWMHRYLGRIPVPVMLGVGAAFDFHTAHQSWAPKWVRTIGMEWLWRLCTGGRRVFIRNVICVSHVACRLLLAALGRVKYLFIKHAVPQPRKIKCGVNANCDGMPCSSSTPYCPYIRKSNEQSV